MTEGHGDDLYLFGKDSIRYNFSSNVTIPPKEIVDRLHTFIMENIDCIHHYPEPEPRRVEELLARKLGIKPGNVCVTNGATEAIYLIAMMLKGRRTYIAEPTFSEYRDACQLHDHHLSEDFSEGVDIYWLCNPNNPTGAVRPMEEIVAMAGKHPDVTFVLDQSYAKFTDGRLLSPEEGAAIPNIVMIHSLTKHFAIPGLRIGYMTAHEDIISSIKNLRMPWSVNALAQEAALHLLNESFPEGWFEEKLTEAKALRNKLEEIGITVHPSDTHFLLCVTPIGTASELKEWLAWEKGMLIRDASNFKGLTPKHFRIASQGHEADAKLCEAIKEWLRIQSLNTQPIKQQSLNRHN